jgi:hypothetical protein
MNEITNDAPSDASRSSPIMQFAVRTCIIAVATSASMIFVADWIIDSAELAVARSINSVRAELQRTQIGGSQFWGRIDHELEQAADPASDLPPEKKQKIINDVRVIVARWRPFLDVITTEMQKPAPTNAPPRP